MVFIGSDISRDPLVQLVVMYVGPDLILPITSALAAVAGVALMFWQRLVGMVLKLWRMIFQRHG
jgi:hypothetical protein